MSKNDKASQKLALDFEKPAADLMQQNLEMASSMFAPFLAANISLLNWNASNCKRMAQAYSQWFDFVGHRFEEDASFAEKLQTTKDPKKLSKVCSTFLETAAQEYQKEVSELTKLTKVMANDATDALQDMSVSKENGAVLGD
jgi:Phasin protein